MQAEHKAHTTCPLLRAALTVAFVIGGLTSVPAQGKKWLTIGDKAPPIHVEAWVKGAPFDVKKGKPYIVEFWATWCGPCTQSVPHLSDLADRMKGKVEVIGVNISDRSPSGESTPGSKVHIDRVTKWVNQHTDTMRYNVVLDDAASTMATTWMFASGQTGIPCAFVVDQEGKIAWIGQPMMGLEAIVEQVYERKFDREAYKSEYAAQMRPQFEAQAKKDALAKIAGSGNLKAIEKAYLEVLANQKHPDPTALSLLFDTLSRKYPATAVLFLQHCQAGHFQCDCSDIGAMAVYIMPHAKADKKASKALAEVSLKNANTVKPGVAAVIYAEHAQVLFSLDDTAGAKLWLSKAFAKLRFYEPAQFRDNIKKYLDDTRAKIDGEGGR